MRQQRATLAPRNWLTDVDLSKSTLSLCNCQHQSARIECVIEKCKYKCYARKYMQTIVKNIEIKMTQWCTWMTERAKWD